MARKVASSCAQASCRRSSTSSPSRSASSRRLGGHPVRIGRGPGLRWRRTRGSGRDSGSDARGRPAVLRAVAGQDPGCDESGADCDGESKGEPATCPPGMPTLAPGGLGIDLPEREPGAGARGLRLDLGRDRRHAQHLGRALPDHDVGHRHAGLGARLRSLGQQLPRLANGRGPLLLARGEEASHRMREASIASFPPPARSRPDSAGGTAGCDRIASFPDSGRSRARSVHRTAGWTPIASFPDRSRTSSSGSRASVAVRPFPSRPRAMSSAISSSLHAALASGCRCLQTCWVLALCVTRHAGSPHVRWLPRVRGSASNHVPQTEQGRLMRDFLMMEMTADGQQHARRKIAHEGLR